MPGSHKEDSTQTAQETYTASKTLADAQPVILASDIPPLARDATVIALVSLTVLLACLLVLGGASVDISWGQNAYPIMRPSPR